VPSPDCRRTVTAPERTVTVSEQWMARRPRVSPGWPCCLWWS